jgi:hypothetical protein
MLDVRPNSTGNVFRRQRIALLNGLVEDALRERARCRVLDIGGTAGFWHTWRDAIDWERVSITCVNANPEHDARSGGIDVRRGDACDLSELADGSFDVVFSNSVIEHVGMWTRMEAMAREVRRLAPRYLVQTPYFWFPIEPHARTPLLHWMPEPLAYRVLLRRRCGYWNRQDTVSGAVRMVQSAKLLDGAQMRALFPDAEIRREKVWGLTKSLMALRGGGLGKTPEAARPPARAEALGAA